MKDLIGDIIGAISLVIIGLGILYGLPALDFILT